MMAGSSIRPFRKAVYGFSRAPAVAAGSAPKTMALSEPSKPVVSAVPLSVTPQLRCNAVWRRRTRPASGMTRNSYQRRFSIGAATRTSPSPSVKPAPSPVTHKVGPPPIANTVCRRLSGSHDCTRTIIVHGLGKVIAFPGVTIPYEPEWTG
jgi:hypothetical protein